MITSFFFVAFGEWILNIKGATSENGLLLTEKFFVFIFFICYFSSNFRVEYKV